MAKRDEGYTHVVAERSHWSGRVTALCGDTAEPGEYNPYWFRPLFANWCPTCRRLEKRGKAHS